MSYCKYCGMESTDKKICEWCGRELPPQVVESVPIIYPSLVPPYISPIDGLMEPFVHEQEDVTKWALLDFLLYCGVMFFLGSSLTTWHFGSLYMLATMAGLFLTGMLLVKFKAVPSFEDGWDNIDIPVILMLVLFLPAALVYVGYMIYNIRKHRMDPGIIWLLTPYFAAIVLLAIVTAATGPNTVPIGSYGEYRGVEFLALSALLLGRSASSWSNYQAFNEQ
jgi:hypothetical protein